MTIKPEEIAAKTPEKAQRAVEFINRLLSNPPRSVPDYFEFFVLRNAFIRRAREQP